MMLKTHNMRMLGIAGLVLVSAVSAVGYMTMVLERDGAELERHIEQLQSQQAYEQEYLAIERLLLETSDDRSELAALILDGEEDTVEFLSEVDLQAARLGVELVTESLEVQVQKSEPFDMLAVRFSISGGEAAVLQMMHFLEVWPYHSRVTDATVRRTSMVGRPAMESIVTLSVTLNKE